MTQSGISHYLKVVKCETRFWFLLFKRSTKWLFVRLSFISQLWDFAPVLSTSPCIQICVIRGNSTAQSSRLHQSTLRVHEEGLTLQELPVEPVPTGEWRSTQQELILFRPCWNSLFPVSSSDTREEEIHPVFHGAGLTETEQDRGEERGRRKRKRRASQLVSYYTLFAHVPLLFPSPPLLPPRSVN